MVSHGVCEQSCTGMVQMPQLGLQQISLMLHVFGPQRVLVGGPNTLPIPPSNTGRIAASGGAASGPAASGAAASGAAASSALASATAGAVASARPASVAVRAVL